MQDAVHAAQRHPILPTKEIALMREPKALTYTILAVGQAQTGKSSTLRNLLASFASGSDFQLADATGLSIDDFAANAKRFTTVVKCHDDTKAVDIKYKVVVRPSLAP